MHMIFIFVTPQNMAENLTYTSFSVLFYVQKIYSVHSEHRILRIEVIANNIFALKSFPSQMHSVFCVEFEESFRNNVV